MRLQPDTRAPARAVRPRVRRAVHPGQAGRVRLPRLPVADPPPHLLAAQPPQHPRPRLQGGGHHHHAVRHGDAQRPGPFPPGHGRHRPGARARAAGPRRCASRWPTRAWPPGATPASTARTTRRSPSGVADDDRMRVLVVNAGSTSLKLRLLGGDDGVAQTARHRSGRRSGGAYCATGRSRTRSATGSCTAAPGSATRSWSTTTCGAAGATSIELAPLHQPKSLERARRGVRAAARRAARWRASTPRSTPRSRPPLRPTRCRGSGGSAARSAATASTASPTAGAGTRCGELCRRCAGGSSPPPRRGRLAGRRRSTAAASTPPWASPRSTGWSWRPARAPSIPGWCCGWRSTRAAPPRGRRRPRAPLGPARAGRHRRHARGPHRGAATTPRALALDVYLHRLRGASRPWPRPPAGSTRWSSPAASASPVPVRERVAGGWASSAWPSTRRPTSGSVDGEITAVRASVRVLVVPAREDLVIARGTRSALAT